MDVFFRYDASGQRIYKQTTGGVKEHYVVDGMETVAVLDSAGAVVHWNLLAGGVAGRWMPGGEGWRYYVKDHLGSVRQQLNDAGAVLSTGAVDYYPFGLQMPGRNTADDDLQERYTGHELDVETGLYYAGARYLDPVIGRWNGVDPLADDYPSWSPYNYALNNPLLLVDPTGMAPEEDLGSSMNLVECPDCDEQNANNSPEGKVAEEATGVTMGIYSSGKAVAEGYESGRFQVERGFYGGTQATAQATGRTINAWRSVAKVGLWGSAALFTAEMAVDIETGNTRGLFENVGGLAGSTVGGTLGALGGSYLGPWGTVGAGTFGGVVGDEVGRTLGGGLYDLMDYNLRYHPKSTPLTRPSGVPRPGSPGRMY